MQISTKDREITINFIKRKQKNRILSKEDKLIENFDKRWQNDNKFFKTVKLTHIYLRKREMNTNLGKIVPRNERKFCQKIVK